MSKRKKVDEEDCFNLFSENTIGEIFAYLTLEDIFKNTLITINRNVFNTFKRCKRLMFGLLKDHYQLQAKFRKKIDYFKYFRHRNHLARASYLHDKKGFTEFSSFEVSDLPHLDEECGGCCHCLDDTECCGQCCGCRPIFFNFCHRNNSGDFCCYCVTNEEEELDEMKVRHMNQGLFTGQRREKVKLRDNIRIISSDFVFYSLKDFSYVYINVDLVLPSQIYERSEVVSWDDFSLDQNQYMLRVTFNYEIIFLGLIHGMKERYQFFRIKRLKEMIKEKGWRISHQSLIERVIQGSLISDLEQPQTYGIDNILQFIGNRNIVTHNHHLRRRKKNDEIPKNVFNYDSILINEISSKVCERYVEYIREKTRENWMKFDRKFPYRLLFHSRLSFRSIKRVYNFQTIEREEKKKNKNCEELFSELGLMIRVNNKECLFFLDKKVESSRYLFNTILPEILKKKESDIIGEKKSRKMRIWEKKIGMKNYEFLCKRLVRQSDGVYKMKFE